MKMETESTDATEIYKPPHTPSHSLSPHPPTAEGPKGIGGWLILVILGLIFSPIRLVYVLATVFLPLFQDGTWYELTTPGTAAYHSLWAPLVIFEIIANLVILVLAIAVLVLLFRRSRKTPRWAIIYYGFSLGIVLADFFLSKMIPAVAAQADTESLREILRSLFCHGNMDTVLPRFQARQGHICRIGKGNRHAFFITLGTARRPEGGRHLPVYPDGGKRFGHCGERRHRRVLLACPQHC
jgi:hypothetical protein